MGRNYREKRISSLESGFTLIELLIVIVIIGILSSFLLSNFIGVRQRARDAQRKSDLRQIQSALELFRADQGTYIVNVSGTHYLNTTSPCPTSQALIGGIPPNTYMQKIPCDPLSTSSPGTTWNNANYYYYSDGSTYTLQACLENSGDTDTNITGTNGAPSHPGSGSCPTGKYYQLVNP